MLKRLAPAIRERIAHLTWPNGRGIVERDGVLYLLNLQSGNWYDKQILHWGAPESEQRRFLMDNIRHRCCDTFLDIGANFGMYALCVAMQTDCKAVIACEPDKRSYDRLRANLLINELTEKVQTRMVAVSDHSGTVPFKRGPDNDASASEVGEDGSGYAVPSVRLDDEFAADRALHRLQDRHPISRTRGASRNEVPPKRQRLFSTGRMRGQLRYAPHRRHASRRLQPLASHRRRSLFR
jgi:FkbM family methyltransferase